MLKHLSLRLIGADVVFVIFNDNADWAYTVVEKPIISPFGTSVLYLLINVLII